MTEKEITARIAELASCPTPLADNEIKCLRMRRVIHNSFLSGKDFFEVEEHYDIATQKHVYYSLADTFAASIIGGIDYVRNIYDEEKTDFEARAQIVTTEYKTYTDKFIKWSDEEA